MDEAHAAYREALVECPADDKLKAAIYSDFGVLLRAEGHPQSAIASYRRALALAPSEADTWCNLGNALLEIGDASGAVQAYLEARRLAPDEADYAKALGWAHAAVRDFEAATDAHRIALELDPSDHEAELALGIELLHLGKWTEGFAAYEARLPEVFEAPPAKDAVAPFWRGEALEGRTLLVQAEQGLGDVLQFSRFLLPLVDRADGPVICQVPVPLRRLFERSFTGVSFFPFGGPVPAHDLCVPLASLPHVLGVDGDGLLPAIPYLSSGDPKVDLSDTGRPKVGLTWSGNQVKPERSCPFDLFLDLLRVPNIDFYSFQRGTPREDIAAHGAGAFVTDLGAGLEDFDDDAALVRQLDLVITIDTSFCHLTGALNVPCWVLLTPVADWRFMTEALETPWYPSHRLIRTAPDEGWIQCMTKARRALQDWADRFPL